MTPGRPISASVLKKMKKHVKVQIGEIRGPNDIKLFMAEIYEFHKPVCLLDQAKKSLLGALTLCFLRKFVKYGQKKFYNVGPRWKNEMGLERRASPFACYQQAKMDANTDVTQVGFPPLLFWPIVTRQSITTICSSICNKKKISFCRQANFTIALLKGGLLLAAWLGLSRQQDQLGSRKFGTSLLSSGDARLSTKVILVHLADSSPRNVEREGSFKHATYPEHFQEVAIKLVNNNKIKDLVIENLQARLRILKLGSLIGPRKWTTSSKTSRPPRRGRERRRRGPCFGQLQCKLFSFN